MLKYKRMSQLTLKQLMAIITGKKKTIGCAEYCNLSNWEQASHDELPFGAAANEIGVMFMLGEKEAEKPLADMLGNSKIQKIGYFYLCQKKDVLASETLILVEKFEQNPINESMLREVQERIDELNFSKGE
ncbi:MAG: hypothetical protein WC682_05220 [Parcubacteria group bacterium]